MKIELIGDKQRFAIEYQLYPWGTLMLCKLRLWMDGLPLGYFDDPVMLGGASACLQGFIERMSSPRPDWILHGDESGEELTRDFPADHGCYPFNIESLDDFVCRAYVNPGIVFLWQRMGRNFEYPGLTDSVQVCYLDPEFVGACIHEFKKQATLVLRPEIN